MARRPLFRATVGAMTGVRTSATISLTACLVLLGGAVVVLAPSAQAATDTSAPRVTGAVSASPTSVDTTSGAGATTLSVRLTDDLSGVADATVTLTGPGGASTDVALDRSAGTALDGTWSGSNVFTTLDPLGTWTPSAITVDDVAGNTLTSTSTSTALGAGVTVVRTADTTAPTLLGVTANVDTVDTTAGPGVVTLLVRASDDLAGVAGGSFTLTSADDGSATDGYLTADDDPVTGTARNGTWSVDVTVPARSTPGRWTLTSAEVTDGQGNTTRYDSAGSTPPPPIALTVRTDDDTTTPALTAFAVGPTALSTGYQQSGYVYGRIDFTDTGSGLASAQVTLQRPDGTLDDVDPGDALFADSPSTSGTSRSGRITVGVWTDFVATGTWSVASVVLTDLAGNTRTYLTPELGSRATFTVSATKADTLAPTVTGLGYSPTRLDVRSGSADGAVLIGVTDPDPVPAGFDNGTVRLTSPSGTQTVDAAVSAWDLADGNPQSGTFRAAFTLDRGAEDGGWKVTGLTLTDAAAHTRSWTAAQLATTLGTPPTLTVLGHASLATPGAPTITSASATPSGVTVNWTPPADNGGAAVTGYVVTPSADGVVLPARTVGPVPSTTLTGLEPGRTYTVTVAAVNAVGTGAASAASNPVTPLATVPAAPLIGAVTLAGTTATVSWTPSSDTGGSALTGFVVTPYLGPVAQAAVVVDDGTSTTVTDLAKGRTYTFRVAALNAVGRSLPSSPSTTVSVAATAPGAPAATSASVAGTTATVRWTPPADTGGAAITAYSVVGSPGGSCRTTATTCTIAGLVPATAYSFTVTASNTVGTGDASPASDRVVAVAPQATTLALTSVGPTATYGAVVPVTGRLTRTGGAGLGNQTVRLQYRRIGATTFTTVPTAARTSSTGLVTFGSFRPGYSVQVRLVADTEDAYASSVSGVRTATVRRALTLATNHASAKRGQGVVLSGRTNPAADGVVAHLQRWASGRWTAVANARVHGNAYSFTVRTNVRGSRTYRVAIDADPGYAVSVSPNRTVRVR